MIQKLPDGTLLVPMRAEDDDGTVGDALVPCSPGEDGYDKHLAEYEAQ